MFLYSVVVVYENKRGLLEGMSALALVSMSSMSRLTVCTDSLSLELLSTDIIVENKHLILSLQNLIEFH